MKRLRKGSENCERGIFDADSEDDIKWLDKSWNASIKQNEHFYRELMSRKRLIKTRDLYKATIYDTNKTTTSPDHNKKRIQEDEEILDFSEMVDSYANNTQRRYSSLSPSKSTSSQHRISSTAFRADISFNDSLVNSAKHDRSTIGKDNMNRLSTSHLLKGSHASTSSSTSSTPKHSPSQPRLSSQPSSLPSSSPSRHKRLIKNSTKQTNAIDDGYISDEVEDEGLLISSQSKVNLIPDMKASDHPSDGNKIMQSSISHTFHHSAKKNLSSSISSSASSGIGKDAGARCEEVSNRRRLVKSCDLRRDVMNLNHVDNHNQYDVHVSKKIASTQCDEDIHVVDITGSQSLSLTSSLDQLTTRRLRSKSSGINHDANLSQSSTSHSPTSQPRISSQLSSLSSPPSLPSKYRRLIRNATKQESVMRYGYISDVVEVDGQPVLASQSHVNLTPHLKASNQQHTQHMKSNSSSNNNGQAVNMSQSSPTCSSIQSDTNSPPSSPSKCNSLIKNSTKKENAAGNGYVSVVVEDDQLILSSQSHVSLTTHIQPSHQRSTQHKKSCSSSDSNRRSVNPSQSSPTRPSSQPTHSKPSSSLPSSSLTSQSRHKRLVKNSTKQAIAMDSGYTSDEIEIDVQAIQSSKLQVDFDPHLIPLDQSNKGNNHLSESSAILIHDTKNLSSSSSPPRHISHSPITDIISTPQHINSIDHVFAVILKEDAYEVFLRYLIEDLLGMLAHYLPIDASYDTISPYNLFLAACDTCATNCIEVLFIITAIVIYQSTYPPNPTRILQYMMQHQLYASSCPQLFQLKHHSSRMLIDWNLCQLFSRRIQDFPIHKHLPDEISASFLQALAQHHIQLLFVLCDYAPVYACKALSSPPSNTSSQLFDLVDSNRAHLIPMLIMRLDLAFRRRYAYGAKYACITCDYRHHDLMIADNSSNMNITALETIRLLTIIDASSGGMIIHWAAEEGLLELVDDLLSLAPMLGIARDHAGLTVLHSAAMMGHAELLSHIVSHHQPHIDRLAVDENGWTALMYAIYREQITCMRILLDNESMVDGENAWQQMQLLGQSILAKKLDDDARTRRMIESLATVPEFRHLLNAAVSYGIDAEEDVISFVKFMPSLLDVDNKLKIVRKYHMPCVSYHIMNESMKHVYLQRHDPWLSLISYISGHQNSNGSRIYDQPISSSRGELRSRTTSSYRNQHQHHIAPVAAMSLQHSIRLQFLGEVGCGPGVEKEVLEVISEMLVRGQAKVLRSVDRDGGGSMVIPIDSSSLPHPYIIPQSVHVSTLLTTSAATTASADVPSNVENNVSCEESASFVVVVKQQPQSYCEHLSQLQQSLSDLDDDDDVEDGENDSDHSDNESDENDSEDMSNDDDSRTPDPVSSITVRPAPSWQQYYPDASILHPYQHHPLSSRFYHFGCLVGHLLLRKIYPSIMPAAALSLDLPHAFWQLVIRREIDMDDIADIDADIYRNMLWMQEHDDTHQLSLTFSATSSRVYDDIDGYKASLSSHQLVELVVHGDGMDVTDSNKHDYIKLMTRHCICGKMSMQADYVRVGILSIIPPPALDIFSAREIMEVISGSTDIIIEGWRARTYYTSGYSAQHPIIEWFWAYVSELSPTHLLSLLQFWTGSTRLPIGGFKHMHPQPCIYRKAYDPMTALPTSGTCFNLLRLPEYPDKLLLRKHLTTAIVYGSQGFSFS